MYLKIRKICILLRGAISSFPTMITRERRDPGKGYSNFHKYVGSGHFWGLQISNFNILGVFFFIKMIFFWGGGYEDFVDILCGHHKIGLYLVVIAMHFSVFS